MKRLALCSLWLCSVGVGVVRAEPITYSEAVHGDLGQLTSPGYPPAPTIFTLDVGVNTFSGTLGQGGTVDDVDFDSIAFAVPTGTQLTTVAYSVSATFLPPNYAAEAIILLSPSIFLPGSHLSEVRLLSSLDDPELSGTAFTNVLPLGPGGYGIANVGLANADGSWAYDYRWSLTVESGEPPPPVPEPATWLLMATGATAILRKRRNRRQPSRLAP